MRKNKLTCAEIRRRLIAGEVFTLFNRQYQIYGASHDGIYDYKIINACGQCVGMARFRHLERHVLLAFFFGRFKLNLKEFVYDG